MDNDVTTYLQTELGKMQRKFRVAGIAMAILVVFLIGYFQWITTLTAEMLEPENIAEFVTNELRGNLPAAADTLSDTLVAASPEMVRFVMQQVMDGVMPAITETVGAQLKDLSLEAANIGSQGVTAAFTSTMDKCTSAAPKRGKTDAISVSEQLHECVQKTMPAELDTASAAILGDKLSASAAMLRQIDGKLQTLANKPKLDREEALGKQLVTTWWSFLERNHPDIAAGPGK